MFTVLSLVAASAAVGSIPLPCPGPAPHGSSGPRSAADGAQRGEVIISEIMANPTVVGNTSGEWFELRNVSMQPVTISGFVMRDDDTDSFTLPALAPLPAGAHLVLGRSADIRVNGGVPVDVEYGTAITLANSTDELVLMDGDTVVDAVRYSTTAGFPDDAGASMSLDPAALHAVDNDEAANWCSGTEPYGDGDLGTPGIDNLACDGGKACGADLDGSGTIDVADLLTLLNAWQDGDPIGDLDGDGDVGSGDLLVLLAAWGPCAP